MSAMANMKNPGDSGYSVTSSQQVFSGYTIQGKDDSGAQAETKPPIPAGMSNRTVAGSSPAHQQALEIFNKNVSSMTQQNRMSAHPVERHREIMIAGTRHPAPSNPVVGGQAYHSGSFIMVNGSTHIQNYHKGGSEYSNSSPRSSVGSAGDSKNSSPRSSLIHPPPPPPYDPRMRNSIASTRSSISFASLDSSPRTSLAEGIICDKLPMTSVVLPSDVQPINLSVNQLQANLSNLGPYHRFNEAAPPQLPAYTDPRLRTIPSQHTASINGYVINSPTVTTAVTQNGSVPSMIATSNLKQRNPAQVSPPPPAIPARVPIRTETPPRPNNQSETEVAMLTQKLQQDLNFSMSPSSSAPQSPSQPREPPPPYHGPHKKEPMPGLPPRSNIRYTSPINSQVAAVDPRVLSQQIPPRNPPSATVRPQIPYQVTPPKPKGPSEAEKKLMALTQELEDQMESTPPGEYFGRS